MKTALAIVQSFCRLSNLSSLTPSSLVAQTDPGILQLIEALIAALEDIRAKGDFDVQKRKLSFDTEDGRAQYPLPADFYAPLPRTHFNQDTDQELIGPESDSCFSYLLYTNAGARTEYTYRIFGPDMARVTKGQIEVFPTPSSEVTLSFEYLSANLFLPDDWTDANYALYDTIAADTDLVPFDDDLVKLGLRAKFRGEAEGDWQSAEVEFQKRLEKSQTRLSGSRIGSFSRKGRKASIARARTPYRSWSM